MITPHPDSDLTTNIMILGSEVISTLKKNRGSENIESLMKSFVKSDKKRTPELFIDTVTFLYSMNIIEYKSYNIFINKNVK